MDATNTMDMLIDNRRRERTHRAHQASPDPLAIADAQSPAQVCRSAGKAEPSRTACKTWSCLRQGRESQASQAKA